MYFRGQGRHHHISSGPVGSIGTKRTLQKREAGWLIGLIRKGWQSPSILWYYISASVHQHLPTASHKWQRGNTWNQCLPWGAPEKDTHFLQHVQVQIWHGLKLDSWVNIDSRPRIHTYTSRQLYVTACTTLNLVGALHEFESGVDCFFRPKSGPVKTRPTALVVPALEDGISQQNYGLSILSLCDCVQ